MHSVPYSFVAVLAAESGAVDCFWRESSVSFTGWVAEVWFNALPAGFAQRWAAIVDYSVKVRCVSQEPGRFAVSVPVEVPNGQLQLVGGTRGGRVRCRLLR